MMEDDACCEHLCVYVCVSRGMHGMGAACITSGAAILVERECSRLAPFDAMHMIYAHR